MKNNGSDHRVNKIFWTFPVGESAEMFEAFGQLGGWRRPMNDQTLQIRNFNRFVSKSAHVLDTIQYFVAYSPVNVEQHVLLQRRFPK